MMKTITFLTVIAAISLQVAAAIPHGHARHDHVKKDLSTETITEIEYVTANPTDPAVIIWVDGEGNVVSTETRISVGSGPTMAPETISSAAKTTTVASSAVFFTAAPPTPAAPPSMSSSITTSPPPAPITTSTETPPSAQPTPAAADSNAKSGPSATPGKQSGSSSNGQFSGLGIAYDIVDNSDNCKNAFTVGKDFDAMIGYSMVRIYGSDCNQVALVTAQAAQRGMKVFVGIGDPTSNIPNEIQTIINQAGANLGVIDTIGIGNEYVNGGGAVGVVTAAIGVARAALSGIYSGHIVTVDTCGALEGNPALCAASDYCAANCHAFFDPNTPAAGTGAWLQGQVAGVAAANPGKSVIVTESGWAWKDPNGVDSRATPDQQAVAISSLRGAFSSNLYLFQAFDTLYKPQKGTEWYFGIYDHDD